MGTLSDSQVGRETIYELETISKEVVMAYLRYLTGGIEENRENPVRIADVLTNNRTKHLPNMRLKRTATPNISVCTPLCPVCSHA
jgi:hypothetical protein